MHSSCRRLFVASVALTVKLAIAEDTSDAIQADWTTSKDAEIDQSKNMCNFPNTPWDPVNQQYMQDEIPNNECCFLTREKIADPAPNVVYCPINDGPEMCCDYQHNFDMREFRYELFANKCKYEKDYDNWDLWFCFGCSVDQPQMTTYFEYDDDELQTTGEIYICEEFALKLYKNEEQDIDLPVTGYDACGMYQNIGWEIVFEDDGGTLRFDRQDIWNPVIPSFVWKDANSFFNEDQFKPPFFRGDDEQNFTVKIIRTAEKEAWEEYSGKKCYNGKGAMEGVFVSTMLTAIAAVTLISV